MKIVLIRPNERAIIGPLRETNIAGVFPPLGLLYIYSTLKKRGFDVTLIDAHLEGYSLRRLCNLLTDLKPTIVGITSTTLLWQNTLLLAKAIKKTNPKYTVVVGGPQLSVYARESLGFNHIDFGIYGEGEETFIDFLNSYKDKSNLQRINGLIFKEDGEIIVNPPRSPIRDLNTLSFPVSAELNLKRYFAFGVKSPFVTMLTSRGCPLSCDFCLHNHLGGFRQRDPENVIEEIDYYIRHLRIREIVFFDETFTFNRKRTLQICDLIRKRNLNFRWNIRTRVDMIDKELMCSLKEAGCYCLHIGIESGDQAILENMSKAIDLNVIKENITLANELGLQTRGYFMIGYPGENRKKILQTIRFACELPLDWATFTITIANPGTGLYNKFIMTNKRDFWRDYTLGRYLNSPPYFVTTEFDEKRLKRLLSQAYLKFYLRPKFVARRFCIKLSDMLRFLIFKLEEWSKYKNV